MRNRLLYIFFPFIIVYLLFLGLPLIRILTFNSLGYLISDTSSGIMSSIYYTYVIALGVALIAVLFSIPYAFIFARKRGFGYRLADSIIEVPIMIPSTVVGVMMLITFEPQMPVGHLIAGLIPGYTFSDSLLAVILTLLFVSSAYSIRIIGASYRRDILHFEEVSTTLGINEMKSFFLVSLPLLFKSIIRGVILSWARAISAVGSILIVAYYIFPGYQQLAGVFIYGQFIGSGLPPAAASSAILIISGIIALALLRVFGGRDAFIY
ncbi:MAG: ABC transporter permease subunit [Thermoplasmata archaeon]